MSANELKSLFETAKASLGKPRIRNSLYAAIVLGSVVFAARKMRENRKNVELTTAGVETSAFRKKTSRVAVNKEFFRRLFRIIRIVVPGVNSREFFYFAILTGLLFARTGLSIFVAELIGRNAQWLVSKQWDKFFAGVYNFALISIPAAIINSGLKYFSAMLSLRFRVKLSERVHEEYLEGTNFYKACNIGANKIKNADQRVTSDIHKFSDEIATLYTTLFKPILDVLLFTYKLADILGWQGPAIMYGYFVVSAFIKRIIMPSFGRLVAKESELEGYYRTAHQRLITNSEEIAFYDGSRKEKKIINESLARVASHIKYERFLRAFVGIFDSLLVKYYASIAGYGVLALPLVWGVAKNTGKTPEELTRDYIRNGQYLGNLTSAVGDLVLVGNKLTSIAGYTSRVSELLEMVRHLKNSGNTPFPVVDDERKEESRPFDDIDEWLANWKKRCDASKDVRRQIAGVQPKRTPIVGGGTVTEGDFDYIKFEHSDIVSPDGKILVEDLSVTVSAGVNVMVTGPNGSGKSSLFRVIGELWPLSNGSLVKPRKQDILFVPQKPYLVLGTLRDQIIYPHSVEDMVKLGVTDDDLAHLLSLVDTSQLIVNTWGWDEVQDWFHAFSGGQKQRVAMARLYYHRPRFAILDECTSAVSDEIEDRIYEICRQLGITIFTVSHRKKLVRHHDYVLSFDGRGSYEFKRVADVEEYKVYVKSE